MSPYDYGVGAPEQRKPVRGELNAGNAWARVKEHFTDFGKAIEHDRETFDEIGVEDKN